jgi:hypothetical protein
MARPGLDRHPKMMMLRRMLGEPRPHVRGYLDCLWETAYENGDPVIGTPEMVEAVAEYPGESGKLFNALLSCGGPGRAGFIEPVPGRDGLFQIHDLYHHAPDYVKKRRDRESCRSSSDVVSHSPTLSDNGGQRQKTADNGGQRQKTAQNGRTPAPAPAPAPSIPSSGVPEEGPRPDAGPTRPQSRPDQGEASPSRESRPRKPRKSRADGDGKHQPAVDFFCAAWEAKYGERYPFNAGKDGGAVKWCLDQLGRDVGRWRAVVGAYLADPDPFLAKDRHGVPVLRSQFRRYLAQPPPADGYADYRAALREISRPVSAAELAELGSATGGEGPPEGGQHGRRVEGPNVA